MEELKIVRAISRTLKEDYFLEKAWFIIGLWKDNEDFSTYDTFQSALIGQYETFCGYVAYDLHDIINHRTEEIRKSVISPTARML